MIWSGGGSPPCPPAHTLDVACGTGFLTRHLPGRVTGLDQSERMLAIAHERVPDGRFVHGEALELAFADGSFERGEVEGGVVEAADGLVHAGQRFFEVLAAAPGGAQCPEGRGSQAGGGWPGAGGVGDRQPGAVAVLDKVEPVAAHFVARQQGAGELGAGDPGDARWEEVLLDLGRGARRLASARCLYVVGVVVDELERRGALLGDVLERSDGGPMQRKRAVTRPRSQSGSATQPGSRSCSRV